MDTRTTFANHCQADIFISIHANYCSNENASGIETFCLDRSLFTQCSRPSLLSEITCNERSEKLAQEVQQNILYSVKKLNPGVKNRQVKHAVPQVLLGVTMPSILIEVGFISNKQEALLLKNKEYQLLLVQGIYQGIISYFS